MPDLLFLLFTYIIEAIIVYLYVQTIYPHKINKGFSMALSISSYIALMFFYKFVINFELINTLLILSANIIIIKFGFKSSLKSTLFHGVMLCVLLYISEFITMYLIASYLHISSKASISEHFEIGSILSHFLYFLCCQLLSKLSTKENSSKTWGKWALLSILPISSVCIILVIRKLTNNISLSPSDTLICILSIAFLFIANIAVYMIYEKAEKNNQELIKLELTNQKNEIDIQYLELLTKKTEQMNIMAHDYKNHLITISAMTESVELKNYINNMIGDITKQNFLGKTKNRFLDVVLNKYIQICQDNNISLDLDITNDNLSFLKDNDISSLFNNMLDNAVEAAKISTNKTINLQVTNVLSAYHKIILTNSCDNKPISKNERLITTKQNKTVHGFGYKSIYQTVKKYNGELQWEYNEQDRIFKLIILIPFEQ